MSELSEKTLESRLLQLKCHFTWSFLEKATDIDALEHRLHNQLIFLVTKKNYIVFNLLAYIMHLKGDFTEAIVNLGKAEERIKENNLGGTDKKYLVTFGNYAWVYYYLKRYEDSQNYIDKIDQINKELKVSPNDNQDIAEIYGEQGWSFLTFCAKYYEKAKECFEKALELDPEDPEWNSGYATAVYRVEGFKGKICSASECRSLPLLKRAIELNPNDAVVKVLFALKLQELERADEGKQYVEEALEQAPNLPYLLRYVGMFYRRAGLVDEALEVLKAALVHISSEFVHFQIGLCYKTKIISKKEIKMASIQNSQMHTEEMNALIQEAIFHFQKAVEYKKTYVYAQVELAKMYGEAKKYRKAKHIFENVLTFPNLTDEEKQQIYLNYGRFEEYTKKSESEAIKHYKKCFQITEPNQDRERCEKALRRLANWKIHSNHNDVLGLGFGLLGFVNKNNGSTIEAIEYYEKALIYDPNNEEYLSDLKMIKCKTNGL